jgi:hypothetical protein
MPLVGPVITHQRTLSAWTSHDQVARLRVEESERERREQLELVPSPNRDDPNFAPTGEIREFHLCLARDRDAIRVGIHADLLAVGRHEGCSFAERDPSWLLSGTAPILLEGLPLLDTLPRCSALS